MQQLQRTGILQLLFLASIPAGFFSCNGNTRQLMLLTNRRELATAVTIYNNIQNGIQFELKHLPFINARIIAETKPDIIIADHLWSEEILKLLRPWKGLDAHSSKAIRGPLYRGKPYLVPLSFELPLLMGLKENMAAFTNSMILEIRHLEQLAKPFNSPLGSLQPKRLGFSPTWDTRTLLDIVKTEVSPASILKMENVDSKLADSLAGRLEKLTLGLTSSIEALGFFDRKYRNLPREKLILEGRIFMARTSFDEWVLLPFEVSERMGLRYLSGSRAIPVSSVRNAALPKKSKSRYHASQFVKWLTMPDTQIKLMQRWEWQGIKVFGFLGGLSSRQELNNGYILTVFPEMRSMIPAEYQLSGHLETPDPWTRIDEEVLTPWFMEKIFNPDYTVSLDMVYKNWNKSSIIN